MRLVWYPIPCLCGCCASQFGKTRIFKSSARMLYATLALQSICFHTKLEGISSPCVSATLRFDPQQRELDRSFMFSASLLEMIRSPLHPPFFVGCSRVFTLSSEHDLTARILTRFLLLAPIPRAASLDNRWTSRASPLCCASLSCSPSIRFLSFSWLFTSQTKTDIETPNSLCARAKKSQIHI